MLNYRSMTNETEEGAMDAKCSDRVGINAPQSRRSCEKETGNNEATDCHINNRWETKNTT